MSTTAHHPRADYDEELALVRTRLDLMATSVRRMLALAFQAFATADADLACAVIARDAAINQMERDNDEACLSLLARRQPVGRDLRFLVSALKVVTDLERIGDLAVNIAEHAGVTSRLPCDITMMAVSVASMLVRATTAFFSEDVALANEVIVEDAEVDDEWMRIAGTLAQEMQRNPATIADALRYRAVAKCLERCADHATNIAEAGIFKVRGDDVRHTGASALVSRPPR